jgi:adenylate cyclase
MTKSIGCEVILSDEVLTTAELPADALPQQDVEIRGRNEPMSVRIVASSNVLSALTDEATPAAA